MDRKQVGAIFETLKEEFLSSKVVIKILSHTFLGQPAVGKSNLEKKSISLFAISYLSMEITIESIIPMSYPEKS